MPSFSYTTSTPAAPPTLGTDISTLQGQVTFYYNLYMTVFQTHNCAKLNGVNVNSTSVKTAIDSISAARDQLFLSEMQIATLIKEKLFLIQLINILFQTVALVVPTEVFPQYSKLFSTTTNMFGELYTMISDANGSLSTRIQSTLQSKIQLLESQARAELNSVVELNTTFVNLTNDVQLFDLITPLYAIAKKAELEELKEDDVKRFGRSITSWVMLPTVEKWSVSRSLMSLQMGSQILQVLCEKVGFQPILDLGTNFNNISDVTILDMNLQGLKNQYISNIDQFLNYFLPKSRNPNSSILFSTSPVEIFQKTSVEELKTMESWVASEIADEYIPDRMLVSTSQNLYPHSLIGGDIFMKKIELCNSSVTNSFLTDPAFKTKFYVTEHDVKVNLMSIFFFKRSLFEFLLSDRSQKLFMCMIIEVLVGLVTNTPNNSDSVAKNELYQKIYNCLNCTNELNNLQNFKTNLELVLFKYDSIINGIKSFCAQKGIKLTDLIAHEENKLYPGVLSTKHSFDELFNSYVPRI